MKAKEKGDRKMQNAESVEILRERERESII